MSRYWVLKLNYSTDGPNTGLLFVNKMFRRSTRQIRNNLEFIDYNDAMVSDGFFWTEHDYNEHDALMESNY